MSEFQAAGHGMEKLLSVAQRESLIIENRNVHIELATNANMVLDPISDRLLHQFYFPDANDTAVRASGDGDCLFNSVSTLLIGAEALAVELRYKTCLEMCLNQDIRKHKDASSFYYISPTYEEATLECAQIGQYSSVWTILGLFNVINTAMDVVYPCVNGAKDLSFIKLNMKLRPKDPVSKRPIKIMWTSTLPPVPGQM